jgi:anhydro-N-acetylmuramic acid kinase
MSQSKFAVGLMTGTVLDGYIDVALLKSDGEQIEEFGHYSLEPYPEGIVELLKETLQVALEWQFKGQEPAIFARTEQCITEEQSKAVSNVLRCNGLKPEDISVIGFHGQSVLHRAATDGAPGRTRQLGDGQQMAELLGIPVAWDFRSADVAAGGQGAPLAPVYHKALLERALSENKVKANTAAVLNLGGVANISWFDENNQIVAFDTGPANAPINDWVARHTSMSMDDKGRYAAAGQLPEARLTELLEHPYLSAAYPKSLDRFDFSASMAEGLNLEDGACLLTAFSASAVGKALDMLPSRPSLLVLCGGGRHNPSLVSAIEKLAHVNVVDADDIGWRGDAIEAECFAFLAERVVRGLPLSFPSTTGVRSPCVGGRVSFPV